MVFISPHYKIPIRKGGNDLLQPIEEEEVITPATIPDGIATAIKVHLTMAIIKVDVDSSTASNWKRTISKHHSRSLKDVTSICEGVEMKQKMTILESNVEGFESK